MAGRLSGKPSHSTTAYHGLIAWAVSTLVIVYLVSSAASGLIGGAVSRATSVLGGAGKAVGGSVQTAVQAAAPSLNSMNDPMASIEGQVRRASGGQDPAALRDAAATSVRAALSGDQGQEAAATDKAAEALAKAQNITVDQAKAEIAQYQQQYKDMVTKTKQQAKEAADATAKAVSRGALFGALALFWARSPRSSLVKLGPWFLPLAAMVRAAEISGVRGNRLRASAGVRQHLPGRPPPLRRRVLCS